MRFGVHAWQLGDEKSRSRQEVLDRSLDRTILCGSLRRAATSAEESATMRRAGHLDPSHEPMAGLLRSRHGSDCAPVPIAPKAANSPVAHWMSSRTMGARGHISRSPPTHFPDSAAAVAWGSDRPRRARLDVIGALEPGVDRLARDGELARDIAHAGTR